MWPIQDAIRLILPEFLIKNPEHQIAAPVRRSDFNLELRKTGNETSASIRGMPTRF